MARFPRSEPEKVLDAIPDPQVIRSWLARAIRESSLLRSLLRVAERKSRYPAPSDMPIEGSDE
jgi:hypothetical protein